MPEDDEQGLAPGSGELEDPAIRKLFEANAQLAQMYLAELEHGKRTVAGLIIEAQRRLFAVASLQKPGQEDAPIPAPTGMSLAERMKERAASRQLSEEGYTEVLDLVSLLGEALDLLGTSPSEST